MKFVIIEPAFELARTFHTDDILEGAEREAGLEPGHVDHGTLRRCGKGGPGLCYVVYDYGLMDDTVQHWLSIGQLLIAGNAVFYSFDDEGETVDVDWREVPPVKYYHSKDEVEAAIARGDITRPATRIGTSDKGIPDQMETIWEWNRPRR